MKHITTIIILFFISFPFANAQHLDFVNAPMNNVGFKWHKKHYGIKGPVSKYKKLHFNEDGYLIKDYCNYFYDEDDILLSSDDGSTFIFDSRGFLISQKSKRGSSQYTFNDEGLLIKSETQYGTTYTYNYTYDNKNRVVKQEYIKNGNWHEDQLYSYTKSGDTLIVEHTTNRETYHTDVTYYYVNGQTTKRTSKTKKGYNSIYNNKLDTYGNRISFKDFTEGKDLRNQYFDISYFEEEEEEKKEVGFAVMTTMRKKPNTSPTDNCVSGDCNNGWGKLKTDKVLLIGKFENGKLNGIGRKEYYNGSILEGVFRNNHINKFGLFRNERTNSLFLGNYINGFKSGLGFAIDESYKFARVGKYSKDVLHEDLLLANTTVKNTENGICQYDCTDGFGVYAFNNGDSYSGYFKNGAYNGPGVLKINNNVTFGNFTDGKLNGYGIFHGADNTTSYKGIYIDGETNGYGEFTSSTNVKTRGIFGPGFKLLKAL